MVDTDRQQPPALNPYTPPTSSMEVAVDYDNELIPPQRLTAGAGWSWISDAWQIFKGNIGLWLLTGLVVLVIILVVNFIPVVNFFVGALNVMFMAGVAYMAHLQVNDEPVSLSDLFIGFKHNTGQLILVFLLSLVAMIAVIIVLVIVGVIFGLGFSSFMTEQTSVLLVAIAVLVAFAFFIPIYMTMWFSPILVLLHDKPAVDAMKISFEACLRNFIPFFIYGLIMMLLSIVALIPFGLGFFVIVPLVMITCYTGYRQIMTNI